MGKSATRAGDVIVKRVVEMRLIIKQACVSVTEDDQVVRVEFTRGGKSLSTSAKPVSPESGTVEIKQSFNQKI